MDPEAVVLGAERSRDEVELRQAGRGAGQPAPLPLLELLDHLGQLRPADVGLDQRARRQLAERVVVGRLVGERLAAALEDLVDVRLTVAERIPAVHLAVHGRLARAVGLVQLLDERLELTRVVRLRQPDHGRVVQVRAEDDREVDLGPDRGLHVVVVIDVVLGERLLEHRQRQRSAWELLREVVHLLPLARAEVAVDRDEGERVGANERGPGAPAAAGRAAAARSEQQGERHQEGRDERAASGHRHSRVGWRPISSQVTRSSRCRQACCTGPTLHEMASGAVHPPL